MKSCPISILNVQESFKRLPGIGAKSAERLTFSLLRRNHRDALKLAESIVKMIETVSWCPRCRNYSEGDLCPVCQSSSRDSSTLCIVEQPEELYAIEKTGEYKGLYYVLHGSISPVDGIGPDELGLSFLVDRVKSETVNEVIIATNPNVSGEATGIYIARMLSDTDVKVSRIALGIPAGGNIGYADEVTMLKAMEGRSRINID